MAITLAELYMVSTGIGFCYVAWGFFAGHIGDGDAGHGGHHGVGEHHGIGDGGHHGYGDAGDAPDMGGDSPDLGGDAPDMGGGHGSHGHGDGDAPDMNTAARTSAQAVRSSAAYSAKKTPNIVSFLLRILSPMTIATFAFWFGMAGLVGTLVVHLPDWLVLLPALVLGYVGMKMTQTAMNVAIAKMRVSSNFSEQQIIGKIAQVSISIPEDKMGEIVYLVGKGRQTAPARTKPGTKLSKDSEVIITDVRDGVFYVEGWDDDSIEKIQLVPESEKTPG